MKLFDSARPVFLETNYSVCWDPLQTLRVHDERSESIIYQCNHCAQAVRPALRATPSAPHANAVCSYSGSIPDRSPGWSPASDEIFVGIMSVCGKVPCRPPHGTKLAPPEVNQTTQPPDMTDSSSPCCLAHRRYSPHSNLRVARLYRYSDRSIDPG